MEQITHNLLKFKENKANFRNLYKLIKYRAKGSLRSKYF